MNKKEIIDYYNSTAAKRAHWKGRNAYYYAQLEKYLKFIIPEGSSVAEIGCGTGELLNSLKPGRGLGIDFSEEMVRIAREKFPRIEFRIEDAEDLKTEEKFDYLVLSDLIGSLTDIQKALTQLKKLCSQRTRVIITYYNYLWEPLLKLAERFSLKTPQPLQSWLSIEDIDNLLYFSGFEVIKKGYKLLLPANLPLISRFFNSILANLPFLNRLCLTEIVVARLKPQDSFESIRRQYTCSVIVPCRNEKGNIRDIIVRTPELGRRTELIFVEGHSKDGTLQEIEEQLRGFPQKEIKVFTQDGAGKGDAVRKGLDLASGDILMILDADMTVSPEDLDKFYDALACGRGEFLMGSRLVYPIEEGAMRFLNLLGNKFFSLAFTYLLGQRIKDTLCGTKALFKSDYRKIEEGRKFFGDFDPFGDFDLIFGASKSNLKISEIPVRYNARRYGTTQISRFKHGWLLLRMCWIALIKFKMR